MNVIVQSADAQELPIYEFKVLDQDGRLALVLTDQIQLAAAKLGPTQAWFYWAALHHPQLSAMCEWIDARQDQWQSWGSMARENPDLLKTHLTALLSAEPLPPVITGYMLNRDCCDRRRLVLSELTDGTKCFVAWERRFKTAAACARAHAWLLAGEGPARLEQLADLARAEGSEAVDALIDRSVAAQRRC